VLEDLLALAEDLELLGEWVRESNLPCPDLIWLHINRGEAVSDGLFFRIKQIIKSYDSAMISLLLQSKDTDRHHLETLYFLFVFYEYPAIKRAVLRLAPPPPAKIFGNLCEKVKKVRGETTWSLRV